MTTLQSAVAQSIRAVRLVPAAQATVRASLPPSRRHLGTVARKSLRRPAALQPAREFSSSSTRSAKQLPPRSERYKKLTKEDIEAFKGITSGVLSTVEGASTASDDDLVAFNEDWMCV
jgi:hypothetical protein